MDDDLCMGDRGTVKISDRSPSGIAAAAPANIEIFSLFLNNR